MESGGWPEMGSEGLRLVGVRCGRLGVEAGDGLRLGVETEPGRRWPNV